MATPLPRLSNYQLTGHKAGVSCLALGGFATPHHHTIASGGYDSTINLWDTRAFSHQSSSGNNNNTTSVSPQSRGSIYTPSPPTSLLFGEASLPSTWDQPTRLLLNSNADEMSAFHSTIPHHSVSGYTNPTHFGPRVTQNLFELDQNALFCAVNNVIYQYDLRKLPPQTDPITSGGSTDPSQHIVSQHIALSTPFGDSIGFLTLSSDGKQLAVCSDDNSIHYIPLVHNYGLAQCIDNELSQFSPSPTPTPSPPPQHHEPYQFSPIKSMENHGNIPTAIVFDPYSPIRVPIDEAEYLAYLSNTTQSSHSTLSTPPTQPTKSLAGFNPETYRIPAFTSTFTNYSSGMDYTIFTNTLPPSTDPLKTPLNPLQSFPYSSKTSLHTTTESLPKRSPLFPLMSSNPQRVDAAATGQISNPPFINHTIMSPNGSTIIAALGDGTIGLYAINRDPFLPLGAMASNNSTAPFTPSLIKTSLPHYLSYLDAIIGLYSSGRSLGCWNTNGQGLTFMGNYRGHMHSIVGISPLNFLQTTQNAQFISRMWLSTLVQSSLYYNQVQDWKWDKLQQSKTGSLSQFPRRPTNPYSFSSLFNIDTTNITNGPNHLNPDESTKQDSNRFFDDGDHETFSSLLRSTVSQHHSTPSTLAASNQFPPVIGSLGDAGAGTGGKGKRGNGAHYLYDFGRSFDDLDHTVTVGLDQTLVMWTGLNKASETVYNVARSQELNGLRNSATLQQQDKANNKGKHTKQPTPTTTTTTTVPGQPRYNYTKLINGVLFDLDCNSPAQLEAMLSGAETIPPQGGSQNGQLKHDSDDDSSMSNYYQQHEDSISQYNNLNRTAMTHNCYTDDENHSVAQSRLKRSRENLISGMYKKVTPEQAAVLDHQHLQLRIPLASKPDAVITDRVGHAYVADGTKKITVIALLKE